MANRNALGISTRSGDAEIAHAAYIGLNGYPVVHGKPDYAFVTASVNGSLDGEYFSQDRATVLAGALPPAGSTTTVVLTPATVRMFGTHVGGTVQYQFSQRNRQGQPVGKPVIRSYRAAAIAEIPPALIDQSDEAEGSVLPPGATRQLLAEYYYAWIGLRLADGTAGIPRLQRQLTKLATSLEQQVKQETGQNANDLYFGINRTDVTRNQVRQAIGPEVIALSAFGAIAAVAMLVLRPGPRAAGEQAGDGQHGAASPGGHPRSGGTGRRPARGHPGPGRHGARRSRRGRPVPLAPVGPVRRYDPGRGIAADPLVLGAGAAACGVLLLGLLTVLALRSASRSGAWGGPRSSALARAAAAGLPAAIMVGTRNALEPGRSVPVRSALLGAIAAVAAVVTAVVFNASLAGLASHPARYGWNWDTVIQAEAGYGSFNPGTMKKLLAGQQAVAAWSEFSFADLPIDGKVFPALGLRHDLGSVQPPTTAGRVMTGGDQIELGTVTLAVGAGKPGAADQSIPVFPSAVAINWAPGTARAQRAALIHRVTSANPDGTPGGTYEMRSALASAVVNTEQMGRQPLALGIGLAVAAVLSLALTVLSLVRRRRHELALLKTIGMTRGQIRAVIAWQTTLTLLIAVLVGGPLGVAGGGWPGAPSPAPSGWRRSSRFPWP